MIRELQVRDTIPPTLAQQIFAIGSAVAGGAAGLILAKEFVGKEDVPIGHVVGATAVSAIFTFGSAIILSKIVGKEPHY